MRRKLSVVLAVCLCFQLFCGTASAEVIRADDENPGQASSFPDVPANAPYAEAVQVLSEMGIIQGDTSGNFNPNNTVTRAQTAAFLCRLLGIEDTAKVKRATTFSDVPESHWASGYIAAIADMGIISGYGNGEFKPNNSVTYAQIIKMLVCAWGYGDMAVEQGGYPNGYIAVANNLGITEQLNFNSTQNCPRKDVAVLIYNSFCSD